MGLNITHTNSFNFENKENLRRTAQDILQKQGTSKESSENILNKAIFSSKNHTEMAYAPQLAIIKASSQISINNPLKETLKYLNAHATKKASKEPIFGEIWELFDKECKYEGELIDFEIDKSAVNIFAA